jgi:hypothetical protein
MDVDARSGEVRQASRMIEVEVREDDVAHVFALEAERLELGQGGHLSLRRVEAHHRTEEWTEPAQLAHVVETDARIDERETMPRGLEQQAM